MSCWLNCPYRGVAVTRCNAACGIAVLIIDELGYLPIDKHGADLLFQIISQR
jgi:DNA replication protein DnaC